MDRLARDGIREYVDRSKGPREDNWIERFVVGLGSLPTKVAPILAVVGAAATHFLPLSGAVTASLAVLVSGAIITVVLAATWLPTRKVLRVPLRDALWRD